MDRHRRVCGRSAIPPESRRGREGPQAASPNKRRGRERRRERGRRRAASPSTCRGRGRQRHRETDGPRTAAPSPRRGRERRRERDGPRAATPSTRRRGERDGPRNASPSPRRGRERRRERDEPRAASPSTSRRRERDGPHDASKRAVPCAASSQSNRGGHERRSEREAPRTASPTSQQRSDSHLERNGPSLSSAASKEERHSGAWPTYRAHERPRTAPPSSHRGQDRHEEPDEPRSASATYDRGHMLQQEQDGARTASSTSYSGHKRHREQDRPRPASPTSALDTLPPPTPVAERSGEPIALMENNKADQQKQAIVLGVESVETKEKERKKLTIFALGDDILAEITRRLHPVELSRIVCAGRSIHRLVNRGIQDQTPSTFLGAVVLRGKKYDVVSLLNKRMFREIQRSVAFLRGSLKQFTSKTKIIDSRYGLMALKLEQVEEKLCLCSPYQRNKWIILPQYSMHTDEIMAGSLIRDCKFGFGLLLVCFDKSIEGSYSFPLIVKLFTSKTQSWERVEQAIHFRDGESLLPHGVCCGGYVYFLSKKRRQILKVDLDIMSTDMIQLPQKVFSQMMITNVAGSLCFATAANRNIRVYLYHNKQWDLRWTRSTPPEAYWTKLIGSADENSLLIVETGADQTHTLKVEDGTWFPLQQQDTGELCIGLEISNPFRFPFQQPIYDLEDSMPECVKEGSLTDIARS